MKRGLLLVIFLVFILNFSLISADKIYEGWVNSGDTFTVGDNIYSITSIPPQFDRIILKRNGKGFLIDFEECKKTDTYNYCYTEKSNASDKTTIDDIGQLQWGLYITLYEYHILNVSVNRVPTDVTIDLGEEELITITANNPNPTYDGKIVFQETLPFPLKLLYFEDPEGLVQELGKNTIYWSTTVPAGQSKSFKYRFEGEEYGGVKIQPDVKWLIQGVEYDIIMNPVTYNVSNPYVNHYGLSKSISTTSANINQLVKLSFGLSNNNPEAEMNYKIEFDIPSEIIFVTSSGITKGLNTNEPYEQGTIPVGSGRLFDVYVKAQNSGSYTVSYTLRTDMIDKEFDHEYFNSEAGELSFTVEPAGMTGTITMPKTSVVAGDNFQLKVYLNNLDPKNSYHNISVDLVSDFFHENINQDGLFSPGKVSVLEKVYKAPIVAEQTNFLINLSGKYFTSSGEELNITDTVALEVLPINQTMVIYHRINKDELYTGENLTVKVYLQNYIESSFFNISVWDSFPNNFQVLQGLTEDVISIHSMEDKEVYIYMLRVPDDYNKSEFIIRSEFDLPSPHFAGFASTNVSVLQRNITEPIENTTTTDGSGDYRPPSETEEEKGFLTKVIEWFGDFFKTLFGG